MKNILTVVNTENLPLATRWGAEEFLRQQGVALGEIAQFSVAVDLAFTGEIDPAQLVSWAASHRVDVAVQNAAQRHKKLLISDMESTLVENEFLDDLAELCGVGARVKEITGRAMNGEIDFEGALRERVALLAGHPVALLEQAYAGLRWMPGAQELASGLQAAGVRLLIVSGGFKFFTSRVRQALGAAADYANDLEILADRLTGEALPPIAGKEAKKTILEATALEMGLSLAETAAVGDGANDLPMLLTAGLGIAYRAKPSVNAAAHYRIQHSDLRAVLYFMGISQEK